MPWLIFSISGQGDLSPSRTLQRGKWLTYPNTESQTSRNPETFSGPHRWIVRGSWRQVEAFSIAEWSQYQLANRPREIEIIHLIQHFLPATDKVWVCVCLYVIKFSVFQLIQFLKYIFKIFLYPPINLVQSNWRETLYIPQYQCKATNDESKLTLQFII